ncbi:hypothetical protein [Metabacillus dongyingensis]|uniref:hypothetical protein n=1 Tax=Metabacillus dongyingensis TaxID=2874282 RepID=UPI001CBE9331|nr:hypothetical protein [Metabacillus dongyingensis]UAL53605.1 hypothetical protein K8L98_07425 [Metabacillus dongyingensis]
MNGNPFVDYLDQFNVLSPNHSKIYDEYSYDKGEKSYTFKIETKVEDYLINILKKSGQSFILTGNAGDGKTRLCRSIFNYFSSEDLKNWPNSGIREVSTEHGTLRIVKDLSELKEDKIFEELLRLQEYIMNDHKDRVYYLIAANEGKLTKFLSQKSELSHLKEQVKLRFKDSINNNNVFNIINLIDVTSSIYVEKVLEEWNKEKNWVPCNSCPKINTCIINLNHKKTSKIDVKNRLVEQYRLLDFLSTHITMREMLIHISYILTGGYKCTDIINGNYNELKLQINKPYYQNFYGHEIEHEAFSEMRALKLFRELDPGSNSNSNIDDFILNGDISGNEILEEYHLNLFNNDLDLYLGYFKKRLEIYRDHNKESNDKLIEEWISKLRRKFYFEFPQEDLFNRKSLIPFQYFEEYSLLFESGLKQAQVKKDLINGLNRAFSKRLVLANSPLYATSENLMIHSSYSANQVKLIEDKNREDVDHIPSKFSLIVNDNNVLPMDLHVFEYLKRLSSGDTHNILREDVEILLDTFKNEIIKTSKPDQYILNVLRADKDRGLYVQDEIEIFD